ncbi:DUF3422 family protein [Mycobacterium tuberculosis]|uniref:DUF3422 family protein n=1 Tax=Mycobacterium tuberculosis TaxID=1773 RepID=UPI00272A2598|nr:DUF3422 family protein [Mycobacterium tuberculosis]
MSQLTDLAARVEQLSAENRVRFTAAEAYTDLVKKRIAELKEIPMVGMQTFGEFIGPQVIEPVDRPGCPRGAVKC